jgi:dolichol-phosphate mannosyltransferase
MGVPYCVIMAGNDKDEPNEIDRLLTPLREGKADFVQGSRWLSGGSVGGDMPIYRKWATKLHPGLFSITVRKHLTESTNGFRAFRCSLLDDQRINLKQKWLDGYELEPYLLFKVIVLGYRHLEVPCTKIYPKKSLGVTKMRPVLDWWAILRPVIFLGLRLKK